VIARCIVRLHWNFVDCSACGAKGTGRATLVLHANLDNTHIEFAVFNPVDGMIGEIAVIRLRFLHVALQS